MIEIKNLSFSYNDSNNVLENINILIDDTSIVTILGESGIGKSTLFNIIAGTLSIQDGEITINNLPLVPKRDVSYMLQKDLLFEHKNIQDNIALPLIIKGVSKKNARNEALKLLRNFKLEDYSKSFPRELSGGMRQRVALLRTYMFNRKFILLDEAFSAIDTITRNEIYDWYINTSQKLKLTTLLITHDVDEAIFLSDRIYVLANKPANVVLKLDIELKNRREKNLTIDPKFIEYKKTILDKLNKIKS